MAPVSSAELVEADLEPLGIRRLPGACTPMLAEQFEDARVTAG